MATSLRELIVSVSADTTKYQREMDRASRMGSQYFRTVREGGADASRAWGAQTAAARTHATAIEASAQAISQYAAVAAGAFSVGALVGMADDWGQISARIKLATQDQGEFTLAQTRLMEIANRTYRDYTEAADQFAGTAQSMREMGFAAADTLDAAEALGLALVAGGSNAQRGAAANDAWAKSMVQGKIATDQFQTLLLQTPRVVQALGEGLGKTTAELQQMAKDGQLTAQVVVPALTSQLGKLNAEVEAMPTTVADAGIRFRNELRAWVGGQNEAFGATQVLVGGIELVTENLEALITVGGAAAFGAMAGKMVQMAASTAQAAVAFAQSRVAAVAEAMAIRDSTLAAQLKAQADLRRAQAAMTATRGTAESARASRNLATALLAERQATLAAAQAQAAYARAGNLAAGAGRAALGLLGGPAGLAITVGMVAAGWLLFRDNSTAATSALRDMTGPLDEVIAKYKELGAAQQMQAMRDAEDALESATAGMRKSINELASQMDNFNLRPVVDGIRDSFNSGAISAEEASRRIATVLKQYEQMGYYSKGAFDDLIAAGAGFEENAKRAEEASSRIDGFRRAQDAAAPATAATTAEVTGQAGAFVTLGDEASKAQQRIQGALVSIPGQIARIGKSAREIAELDVADAFAAMAKDGVNFADRSNPQVQEAMRQGAEYIRLQAGLADAQRRYADSTRAASTATSDAKRKAEEARREAERQIETYNDLIATQERQIALFGNTSRAAEVAYDAMHGALARYTDAQKDALQQNAAWLDWLDEMADIEKVWEDVSREVTGKQKEQLDRMTVFAEQAGRNIQSALGDSLYDILDGRFSDIGDSFANMLKRMAAELAASQMLSMLGGAMAGYGGTGTWGNLIRGIGGAMQTSGGRAGGGRVEAFKAYDIAEHGQPEVLSYGGRNVLIMGAQGGMVSPLMNAKGGGAGAVGAQQPQINVQIVKGANEDRVESSQAPGGGVNLRIMVRDTVRALASSGELDGAMQGRFGLRPRGVSVA